MAERIAATIVAEKCGHPTGQKDSQAEKADTRARHREEIPKKNPLAPPQGRLQRFSKWTIKWLWKATIFFGFWLGIVSGYFGLLQRISVSQNEQLDPSDPFSSPFIVSNDGPLPIENVLFRCGLGRTTYERGKGPPAVIGGENFGSSFIFMPDATGKLPPQNFGSSEMNPGERSTIPSCPYPFPKDISGGGSSE